MLVQRIWYWINLFHLITCLLDVVMILEWEILSSSFIWVKGLILPLALVFRGRNIVGASSLNIVVMTDIDGKHFWRFSPWGNILRHSTQSCKWREALKISHNINKIICYNLSNLKMIILTWLHLFYSTGKSPTLPLWSARCTTELSFRKKATSYPGGPLNNHNAAPSPPGMH